MLDREVSRIMDRINPKKTLVAAFNAFGVCVGDEFDEQMFKFSDEFRASIPAMAKRLFGDQVSLAQVEDFAVEWMDFSNWLGYLPYY